MLRPCAILQATMLRPCIVLQATLLRPVLYILQATKLRLCTVLYPTMLRPALYCRLRLRPCAVLQATMLRPCTGWARRSMCLCRSQAKSWPRPWRQADQAINRLWPSRSDGALFLKYRYTTDLTFCLYFQLFFEISSFSQLPEGNLSWVLKNFTMPFFLHL